MNYANRQVLDTAMEMQAAPPGAIRIRFDAGRQGIDPIVYACVNSEDLCRIPPDELSVLGIGADMSDDGGDPIFFMGTTSELHLYVDLDAYPNFQSMLAEIARSNGLCLAIARGDWAAMTDDAGEVVAPDIPGFVRLGYEKVSPDIALVILADMNADLRGGRDDQGPELH
ncbi:hypothetical protein [Pseudosulfitobacter pseudonitzschiae]|uniref:hypothetical protein n=1 Tax=Pseudosulfitobacter pseudonitzschiae TaxID=1402135 RepID=UPI003B794E6C